MIRSGQLAVELLRPVDFQARAYVETLADLCVDLILKAPLVLLAIAVFGLQLPSDPWVYLAFLLTMALGHAVLFSFDWIFACLAFYSTETWGLSVIREGIALFFSGALVPLTLMPDWLRGVAAALPFAQALYVPASILSGITPLSAVPQSLVIQGAWLCGLGLVSRWVFRTALRVVTVQGG
jgi:ABC-2 type transport system permease protein